MLEGVDVLEDAGEGHACRYRELRGSGGASADSLQDVSPVRIGQRRERAVQLGVH